MLGWLLAGLPTTEIRPGVCVLPRWMDLNDAQRLAEAIAELPRARLPVLQLPLARVLDADPAQRDQTRGVILIESPNTPIPPDLLPLAVVLVVGAQSAPAMLQPLREGLRLSLSRALANETHPLRLLGAGPWLVNLLTQRATEPLDLLDLLELTINHRRRYAEQDEDAWERSVAHAAGALVAQRLLRLPVETRWDALRALLALPASGDGVVAAERLGLVQVEASGPRPLSLARGLTDGETRGGLLAGFEGETLPEDLRAALLSAPVESSVLIVSSPTPIAAGGALVADAARAWIGGLTVPHDDALLSRGLDALALANKAAHYSDDARLSALGPVVLTLRVAARGSGGGALAAEALAELIVLTAAWLPADEEAQAGAVEALRRLRSQGVIPQDVWAAALLRRAERLLDAPRAVDQRAEAEAVLNELAALGVEGHLNAERYSWVGRLADQRGEPAEALSAHQTAAAGFAAVGHEQGRAVALAEIADLLEARGELDEALRIRREEVLPVIERLGDEHGRAITMGKIAGVLEARGDLDEALRIRQQEELPVYERVGDIRQKAVTLVLIADTLRRRGQLEEAMRIYRDELLPVFERIGDVREKAVTMSRIADMLHARGELDEALRIRREEVLPVVERLGDSQGKAATLSRIADVLTARGEHVEALRIYREQVLPIFDSLGAVRSRAMVMGKIAEVLLARGEHDEALRIYREETLPIFERIGDVFSKAVTMGSVADILHARGELDEALRIRREEVLPVYERLGDIRGTAVTMGKIADVLQTRGELDEALRIRREEELPVYESLGSVHDWAVAKSRIAGILHAQGKLDESLRVQREEVLPVYERLGLQRDVLVTQTNIATNLLLRHKPKHRPEADALLTTALKSAIKLSLPAEAEHIRSLFRQYNLRPPH